MLDFGGLLPVEIALRGLQLVAERVDLLLRAPHRFDLLLFSLPDGAHAAGLLLQLRELPLRGAQPLLARHVGLLLQRFAVDLKLRDLS